MRFIYIFMHIIPDKIKTRSINNNNSNNNNIANKMKIIFVYFILVK